MVWLGVVGLEAGHLLGPSSGQGLDRCWAVEELEVAVIDQHGDRGAGVAMADLEFLAGDLDAALAGDPPLNQRRPMRSLQRADGCSGALQTMQGAGRNGRWHGL